MLTCARLSLSIVRFKTAESDGFVVKYFCLKILLFSLFFIIEVLRTAPRPYYSYIELTLFIYSSTLRQ